MVGNSLKTAQGADAASFNIAEQYISAFSNLAQTNNTLIMSSDASDIAKMSAQVRLFTLYLKMTFFNTESYCIP